jgi:hypothetical protein
MQTLGLRLEGRELTAETIEARANELVAVLLKGALSAPPPVDRAAD